MAEFGAPRQLVSPAGTIDFNTRFAAEYFIVRTMGEDGTGIRAPMDNRAGQDGGLPFPFKREPRHITVEGVLTLDPLLTAWQQIQQRNQLEEALTAACGALLDVAVGTWEYSPTGMASKSVTVQCDMDVVFTGDGPREFIFGLVAATPAWA